jgi:hypothetical protein
MWQRLHALSPETTSHNGAGRQVMVYMCECGTKWTNSNKLAWECKCGRPLIKRNGIIHTAICEAAGHMASASRAMTATD